MHTVEYMLNAHLQDQDRWRYCLIASRETKLAVYEDIYDGLQYHKLADHWGSWRSFLSLSVLAYSLLDSLFHLAPFLQYQKCPYRMRFELCTAKRILKPLFPHMKEQSKAWKHCSGWALFWEWETIYDNILINLKDVGRHTIFLHATGFW